MIDKHIEYCSDYFRFFFDNFKQTGFEIYDIRFGGIMCGLDTAQYRISEYLDGRGDLSELEEEPLLFEGAERVGSTVYASIATASTISKIL